MVGRALAAAVIIAMLGGCIGDSDGGEAGDASQAVGLRAICAADAVLPEIGTGICTQVLAPSPEREREASIAAHPTDPNKILVTWRNAGSSGERTIEAAYTSDAGTNWVFTALSDPAFPALPMGGLYTFDSTARFGPDGTGYILYGEYRHVEVAGTGRVISDVRMTLASTSDGVAWVYHGLNYVPDMAAAADYMDLTVAPDTGRLVVVAQVATGSPAFLFAGPTLPVAPEGIWVWTSDDQGATWSSPKVPIAQVPGGTANPLDSVGHQLPRVTAGPDGLVIIATNHVRSAVTGPDCLECLERGGFLTISRDGGDSWEAPRQVFAYNTTQSNLFNDPAAIWKDSTGLRAALVYGEDGAVWGLRSDDAGRTWTAPIRLASPPNGTSHVFLRAEARDDGVWASYRWGSDDPPRFGASMLHWTPAGVQDITVADWPIKGEAPPGFGDDYGAVAVAADGTAWMAFSDGENGGERVRVAHVGEYPQ